METRQGWFVIKSCVAICTDHMIGVPVSREALRSLLHVDIKQEGSAYQIGITNSMKDFYTMDGPLIGRMDTYNRQGMIKLN